MTPKFYMASNDVMDRREWDESIYIISKSGYGALKNTEINKGSITIVADFSPEFNLQFRWRSEHQPKNHRAYQ